MYVARNMHEIQPPFPDVYRIRKLGSIPWWGEGRKGGKTAFDICCHLGGRRGGRLSAQAISIRKGHHHLYSNRYSFETYISKSVAVGHLSYLKQLSFISFYVHFAWCFYPTRVQKQRLLRWLQLFLINILLLLLLHFKAKASSVFVCKQNKL